MKLQSGITIAFFTLFALQTAHSQKDDNIGTQVVNVVKPYTPSVSDAFKVKETPPLEDEDNTKKEDIKYNIFSFPVASTFTPSKGRAAGVDKEAEEELYDNFATLGIGNYGTANAELFITREVGESGYVGGMIRHLSSEGGIETARLEDGFRDSSIDLTYGNITGDMSWNVDAGYQNQAYNWYGLPQFFMSTFTDESRNDVIAGIDPQHSYHNLYLGTTFRFNESIFSEASAKFNRFSDSYGAAENRFFIRPEFAVDINDTRVKTNIIVDYLSGTFDQDLTGIANSPYSYTNIGIHPSFNLIRDDWSINFGAAAFFSMDMENSDNNIYIYPQVNASLNVVGDLMIFYAGAEGTLEQNSYRDFTNVNPFLAPGVAVAPTDRQYDIFAGLKGKLAGSVSYNVRGSYVNERNRAMFKSLPYTESGTNDNFAFGNSFNVVYDDMKTISFFGELKADFSKTVSFGVDATFSNYSVDLEAEAWNLPALQVGSSIDVNITKKWYAGANFFYIGERFDSRQLLSFDPMISDAPTKQTLEGYFDLNAHVGYKYSDRLTAFIRAHNIANQDYQRWLDYPVQGFQAIIGASYKFDF
ncbi:MAG TPA: TonB-dependent receptor [Flavobacterium sp.]|jgi:hypothetical protein